MAPPITFEVRIKSFLHFCRSEKGLAKNSLEAYRRDLLRFGDFLQETKADNLASASLETLRLYLDSLRQAGLANRSIARQVTTLRNFFAFLAEQGDIQVNPADLLIAPKIGSSLPKYLDTRSVDRLLTAPADNEALGLRDRAMLDLLYATGMRVSELIKIRIA